MRPPTANPVTQGKHGTYNAIDYSYLPDPNIYAPEGGTVTFYASAGNCGNNLQIRGSSGLTHGFCHLEKALVAVGATVRKGQKIGIMGYTGLTIPAGPAGRHLHWVLRSGNTYYYPPTKVTEPFGGTNVATTLTPALVKREFLVNRGKEPSAKDLTFWTGKTLDSLSFAFKAEMDATRKQTQWYKNQLELTKKALEEAQNKPPEVVIKEVEKIVTKEVPVEVKVGEEEAVKGFFSRLIDKLFFWSKS